MAGADHWMDDAEVGLRPTAAGFCRSKHQHPCQRILTELCDYQTCISRGIESIASFITCHPEAVEYSEGVPIPSGHGSEEGAVFYFLWMQ